jgi:UDP:flavonoid glycosyltransferase YjiC (YdhE family)
MHITILTTGSRGDIQPYLALGLGLRQAGHSVQVATHQPFESLVHNHGLAFAPVAGDMQALLSGEDGQKLLESGGNPIASIRQFAKAAETLMTTMLNDFWSACQHTDVIISSITTTAGYDIAEKLNIPFFLSSLLPITANSDFPFPTTPPGLRLGQFYNALTYPLIGQILWQTFRTSINRWRQSVLNLPAVGLFSEPFRRLEQAQIPILYGYSSTVIPKPTNWCDRHHVTGYWFLDAAADFVPPADLVDFLAAGSPPICIGFGSMTGRDPATTTEIVLAALKQTGQRGILLSGWGGIGQMALPDTVFQLESVPHNWLFPRVSAVVHHGGAGTIAAGLRAGVPAIVIPFFSDQPFWGDRLAKLGVAPQPIPKKTLTVERLTTALQAVTSDHAMRSRAATIGEKIRVETGVQTAVATIEHYLKNY